MQPKKIKIEVSTNETWTKEQLVGLLPPTKAGCEKLTDLYFGKGELVTYGLLDPISFRESALAFFESPDSTSVIWIAELVTVLLTASAFDMSEDADVESLEDRRRALSLLSAVDCISRDLFYKSLTDINLIRLRCLVILSQMFWRTNGDAVSASISEVIRVSIIAGLHLDFRNYPSITEPQASLRRRLWATVVELEIHLSFEHGSMPTIRSMEFDIPFDNSDNGRLNVLAHSLSLRLEILELVNKRSFDADRDLSQAMALDNLLQAALGRMPFFYLLKYHLIRWRLIFLFSEAYYPSMDHL